MATYSRIVAWKIPWTEELYHLVLGYHPWFCKVLNTTEHVYNMARNIPSLRREVGNSIVR